MAAEENIIIKVAVDTAEAQNTLQGLEGSIDELKKLRDGEQIGSKAFNDLSASIQKAESRIKDVELQFESLDFEQKLTAGMDAVTGLAGGFVAAEGAMLLFGTESEALEETLRRVGGALALTSGLRDLANGVIAMRKFGLATKLATARQWALNVAMNANPISLIIGLLAAVTVGVLAYAAATQEMTEEERKAAIQKEKLNKASKKAAESIADEQVKLTSLLKVARDRNASDKARAEAVKQLNELSPEYLGALTTENVLTEEGTKLIDQYNKALQKKALAQALEEELVELFKEQIRIQKEAVGSGDKLKSTNAGIISGLKTLITTGDLQATSQAALNGIYDSQVDTKNDLLKANKEEIKVVVDLLALAKEDELQVDANTRAYEKRTAATKTLTDEQKALRKEMELESETLDKITDSNEDRLQSLKDLLALQNESVHGKIEQNQATADAVRDIWMNTWQQMADMDAEATEQQLANKQKIIDTANEGFQSAQNQVNMLSALNDAALSRQLKGLSENDKRREQIERKAFERGKKIQIAQAIISGLQGVVNIWSAQSSIPQPYDIIPRAINTAVLIATTAAQISKIKSTPFGGGGSVSGGGAGASAGAGGVPINNISNTASLVDQQQQEITAKVVVVESDITTTQENVATVSEVSTF